RAQESSRQHRIEFRFVHGHDCRKDLHRARASVLVDSNGSVTLFENPVAPIEQAGFERERTKVISGYRWPGPIAEDFYSEARCHGIKAGKRNQEADVLEPTNQTPLS